MDKATTSLMSFADAVNSTTILSRYFNKISSPRDLLAFINSYGAQCAAELLRNGINLKFY